MMQAQRNCCVQSARTRSMKIVQEMCLGLLIVKDLQNFVNRGQQGLLDVRHLSGQKHCILEDLWLKVLKQFLDS